METIEVDYMMEYQHPSLSVTEDCWLQRKSADSSYGQEDGICFI